MNILIYGAGAVGGWLGANLAQAGCHVTLTGRPAFAKAVNDQGLIIESTHGASQVIHNVEATTSLHQATTRSTPDALLLCMKAYDIDAAIHELAPIAPSLPALLIASFQNGIGNEEKLAAAFRHHKIISGTLTSPVSAPQPGVVRLERKTGGVALAAVHHDNPAAARLAEAFERSPLQTKVYPDYRALKWSKMVLNIMANATSAILDLPPGRIYHDRRLFRIEIAMLREALAVMRASGIQAINLPGAPAAWLARLVSLPAVIVQPVLSQLVARGRGGKMPSFYYDVPREGKTAGSHAGRCEAPYLNGAIVEAGKRCGVPAPVNEQLLRLLMDLVEGRQTAAAWQGQANRLAGLCHPATRPQ